jgi:hypothetical protein
MGGAMILNSAGTARLVMDSDSLIASKTTTQFAPLERLLANLRTRKIQKYVLGKGVLDFGCGSFLRALRSIDGKAKVRYGIDAVFKSYPQIQNRDGIFVAGSFTQIRESLRANGHQIDCVISLACFEHLERIEFKGVLQELYGITEPDAVIVGTVPTPAARPVLEFLSYRLGLIDPSQIMDHKVYYDSASFSEALEATGWELVKYRKFQLGMNSFFELKKVAQR